MLSVLEGECKSNPLKTVLKKSSKQPRTIETEENNTMTISDVISKHELSRKET